MASIVGLLLAALDEDGWGSVAPGLAVGTAFCSARATRSAGIVVGSRGLTGLSAAHGSVSSGVVHHSRRPVVVPPADTGP